MSEPTVTDEDREKAADVLTSILEDDDTQFSALTLIAMAIAAEREKARAPFLALLDVEPDMQPLWEFERGALRGIEMCKAAIRRAAEEGQP